MTTSGTGYIASVDGLRAIAVIAVLAFHADVGIAPGGFLGVSLFFTLSGFLISSLLLREHAGDGSINLRRFYARRWRRLAPSAWVCIAGALGAWVLWSASQQRGLPGDALAALGNVANWRYAFAERSYQELFIGEPSPLAHFWSLAIEEQFYAVMPLIAILCLRRSRRTLSVTVGVLLVASVVANVLTADRNLVYNGTHTRAAELLVGVLLALYAPQIGRVTRAVLGWAALGAFGVLVATTSVTDSLLYHGGLPAFSVVSALLVVAAIAPQRSALTSVLALGPLVAIGRWSYALYLVHWPIYLALNAERTGLSQWPLLALRVSVSVIVAAAVTGAIERPIRTRRVLVRSHTGALASVTAAACIVAACIALPTPSFTDNERLLTAGDSGEITFNNPTPPTTEPEPARPPVLVVGSDPNVARLLRSHGLTIIDASDATCPLTPAAETQLVTGVVLDTSGCLDVAASRLSAISNAGVVDVVVAFGAVDEGVVRQRTEAGFPPRTDYHGLSLRWRHVAAALTAMWDRLPADLNVQLLRIGAQTTNLNLELTRFAASRSALGNLHFSVGSVIDALSVTPTDDEAGLRVMVVGDSTSVILAEALHRATPGFVDVLWIGANGCPAIPIEAARSSADEPWQQLDCPSNLDAVAEKLHTFRPDAVVLMVSGVELLHQRYAGDSRGYVAGDRQFTAVHDEYMVILMALLDARTVPLLIADCPQLLASDFIREESASPARVAAWNAQIQRWVESSPNAWLLPYAAAINEREQADANEPVLIDGIHADVDIVTELVRDELLDVITAVAAG